MFGLHNHLLVMGDQFLEVVAPTREGTAGGRYLERRGGDGGYMVITQCEDREFRDAHIAELGVRTVLDFEDEGFSNVQLHPKDTGGTFFEIDFQADDGWHPAGPDWAEHVKTDVTTAIEVAEIQAPDPAALAARWCEIADIEPTTDEDGNVLMPMANAAVRFVTETDGRGEGLSGIDVRTVDRDKVIAVAQERGCIDDNGQIVLGGLRVNLVG